MLLEDLDLNNIQDIEQSRRAIIMLFNLLEDLKAENRKLQEENQRLRDENNRLKGEQGKPDIKPNKPQGESAKADHSSEAERRKPRERQKSSKLENIKVDRQQVLPVDPAQLPPDAQFKGYEEVVVQDILIQTDNVLFRKEKYYSPAERKSYLAELPAGYQGQFGPGIKSLAIVYYFGCNMSEPKILEFFSHFGIRISAGELSHLLTQGQPALHAEKDAIYQAGLLSSPWHHIDDTGTRVNGQNNYCHILCNPLYTAYFTKARKDRLTVLDILRNGQDRTFRLNEETEDFLRAFDLSERIIRVLQSFPQERELSEGEFVGLLNAHLPNLGTQKRTRILDAVGVATYHTQREWPVIKLLLCDDAPQFQWLTEELALCWVHEGRHYKKLEPYVPHHRQLLEDFLEKFWQFYDQLLAYRQEPNAQSLPRTRSGDKRGLSRKFDTLFSTVTGYRALDERIEKTRGKKSSLLMVLDHPEIPLHNNPAELGARMRVRKRDVSFGPRTPDGAKAWDTLMTIAATAKKLGVSFYRYIHDRVSGTLKMPSLADLITEQAKQYPLGLSWDSS